MYKKAFSAIKISEWTRWSHYQEDGKPVKVHISILLAPGSKRNKEHIVTPEIQFDNEDDLRSAYNTLIQEGRNYSIGSYPWAPLGALVTDKYGVTWWLRT